MKFISWNIDSINAAVEHKSNRGEMTWQVLQKLAAEQPDVLAIQETKLRPSGLTSKQADALTELFGGYYRYVRSSTGRSGYSGTMMFTKIKPVNVTYPKLNAPEAMDLEGRVITLEFPHCYVTTVYTPNSGRKLDRLPQRMLWDDTYRDYLQKLNQHKPVIASGDFNVAHRDIDLKHPAANHHHAGFTDEERQKFTLLLHAGFTDTFRYLHPDQSGVYTWWSQISKTAKVNNSGWRIDYYLVSESLNQQIAAFNVVNTGERQDHAPIKLQMKSTFKL
ncbi:exodeoxyribonuclease III [Bombilactobacillus folatiphilus]|uniref:Exodeoxyribonuclease III n=1 Tax=Bombilactobacillus folatiphilus TaxID=2923362 RepID=A0ABY4PAN1_9LACO|nr:exodeoxyribonuclease III [Bombilactobacillus folatiphilus]UQS82803.1 exodeoxyribonuclease III [Bombilactobacillus folatiphilus]